MAPFPSRNESIYDAFGVGHSSTSISAALGMALANKDNAENKKQTSIVNSPEIKQIIKIVEDFLKKTKCVCYGGTAINNILPVKDQFYNMSVEIPDYDFYSNTALTHAKQLADIYFKKGFKEVEAKAGMHHGTFKVFVNFIPVADISQLTKETFIKIKKNFIFFKF